MLSLMLVMEVAADTVTEVIVAVMGVVMEVVTAAMEEMESLKLYL